MESRKGDARDVCEIAAEVLVTPSANAVPCKITDISERGARLVLDADIDLPNHFILRLPLLDDQYESRSVELKWRRGAMSGVLFMRPDSSAGS